VKGVTVLDLLVGPDGKVRDSGVVTSSGDKVVDESVQAMLVGAVFPEVPGYTSSDPYVTRFTATMNFERQKEQRVTSGELR
jgi:TonB family protein